LVLYPYICATRVRQFLVCESVSFRLCIWEYSMPRYLARTVSNYPRGSLLGREQSGFLVQLRDFLSTPKMKYETTNVTEVPRSTSPNSIFLFYSEHYNCGLPHVRLNFARYLPTWLA
jgi:hypothetical protein